MPEPSLQKVWGSINALSDRLYKLERRQQGHGFNPGPGGDASVAEGPDIDLVWAGFIATVGRGIDTVLQAFSDGSPAAEFNPNDAGLTAALAACSAGDMVILPPQTISGGPWIVPAGVTLYGIEKRRSILDGLLTGGHEAVIAHLSIVRTEVYGGSLIGVMSQAASETLRLFDLVIDLENTGAGESYGVYSNTSNSLLYLWGCEIRAVAQGASVVGGGYAAVLDGSGRIEIYHGKVYGSSDRFLVL